MIDRDVSMQYINKGKAYIHGFELGGTAAITSKTVLSLGYIHQDERDTVKDISLAWIPKKIQ
jgi:outer membrane receptor for ferrienterochelin and colicin